MLVTSVPHPRPLHTYTLTHDLKGQAGRGVALTLKPTGSDELIIW